jgi:hypothetical protein
MLVRQPGWHSLSSRPRQEQQAFLRCFIDAHSGRRFSTCFLRQDRVAPDLFHSPSGSGPDRWKQSFRESYIRERKRFTARVAAGPRLWQLRTLRPQKSLTSLLTGRSPNSAPRPLRQLARKRPHLDVDCLSREGNSSVQTSEIEFRQRRS